MIYDVEGREIGIIIGLYMGDEKSHDLISGIEKIKKQNIKYLILEEIELFNKEEINLIETETNLKILDGMDAIIYFFPIVLEEYIREKEILIFNEDKEITKKIILSLSKKVKSITLVEDNEDIVEEIYDFVLEKTGLSIFHSKNINRILKNYSIIINFNNNTKIDENQIRKEALIFDFSLEKGLKANLENTKKEIIEDFIFKTRSLDILKSDWIDEQISSSIYEYFNDYKINDFQGLLVNGEVYSPKDFINGKIRHLKRL